MAQQYGTTVAQLAPAWLMKMPGSMVLLVATANPEHVSAAVAALDMEVDRETGTSSPSSAAAGPWGWVRTST